MKTIILLALAVYTTQLFAQQEFTPKQFASSSGGTMLYQELQPNEIAKDKKYPLVLFLHGAGERGDDNRAQLTHGSRMFTNPVNRERYPAYVLFPQCPADKYWSFEKRPDELTEKTFSSTPPLAEPLSQVMELLEWYIVNHQVDKSRVYVVGLSMGGMATFDLACRFPNLFAAAVPICGGIDPARLTPTTGKVSFRIFHGDADKVVPAQLSRNAYVALRQANAAVEYIEFPGVEHNSWTPAFNRDDFMEWIFNQKK